MSNPFDETLKHLVETQPEAWLEYIGLSGKRAVVIDADLSTLTAEADKVLKVTGRKPFLVHLEFQSSYLPALGSRTLFQNVLLRNRHDLPVRSVIILLRKRADGPQMTGTVHYTDPEDGVPTHEFRYRIVRVWERPVEAVLSGPSATLPLAPLSAVTRAELPDVIRRMQARLQREFPVTTARELWSATYILMGLKYPDAFTEQLLKGVQGMEDSTTYQAIIQRGKAAGKLEGIQEGIQEGKLEGVREVILRLGSKRFGEPAAAIRDALEAIQDLEQLEQLADRLLEVESWQELLQ